MSLYGVMRTGGSGMNAQSNKLSTVADNIANVNTVTSEGVELKGEELIGVLRLRGCFATRSGHSAQDDNLRFLPCTLSACSFASVWQEFLSSQRFWQQAPLLRNQKGQPPLSIRTFFPCCKITARVVTDPAKSLPCPWSPMNRHGHGRQLSPGQFKAE